MNIRIFRKAVGLLIVDIVIIIGIFILQFRTDSNIIQKFGDLQVTFEQLETPEKDATIKNKFIASYKGFTIFCDDKKSVQITDSTTNEKKNVKLINWKQLSDLSCQLIFTDNVSLFLTLTSDSPTATLNTTAVLPTSISNIFVPYNYSYNMKIIKNDENKVVLSDKKSSWEIDANSLSDGYLNLNKYDLTAAYSSYNVEQKFTFENIVDIGLADKSNFDTTIENFKQNLISAFKANNSESSITEQNVVSYIAAMAEKGNYVQAIDDIPQSFKKSKQRTYLSAPYLNTLETMNEQLEAAILENSKTISNYAANGSMDIFSSRNVASHLCVCSSSKNARTVLENAAAVAPETLTISQATGVIQAFVDLSTLNPEYAKILLPVLKGCVERITDACSYDGTVLTISENDTFLSVVQAVETGIAILRYGSITGNEVLVKAGRVLVNSYISESSSFDLRTLSNLYPIIAYDNMFYPHYEQIQTDDGRFVWAWTCAKSIFYEKDSEDNSITLNIDFPEGYTHYLIIKGIPQFTSIYIYNMSFRTDPRFETYNSSGYVYKAAENTLLLKSRHKSRFETVRLEYDEEVIKRRAEATAAKEAEEKAEKQKTETEKAENTETNSDETAVVSTPKPVAEVPEETNN